MVVGGTPQATLWVSVVTRIGAIRLMSAWVRRTVRVDSGMAHRVILASGTEWRRRYSGMPQLTQLASNAPMGPTGPALPRSSVRSIDFI
jgi:hypothetical protein